MDERVRREFCAFVEARTTSLFRLAYTLTAHQQSAEDLVQIGLEKVALRWRRVDDPDAYVKQVMYHQFVSWTRRRQRRTEILMATPPEPVEPVDPTGVVDLRDMVLRALALLPLRQRAILVFRYLDDRTDQEIAEILGCTRSTVSSQAHRALARLRVLCPELSGTPEGTQT